MTNSLPQRRIHSFVRRQGRMTAKQAWSLEQLWPKYTLPADQDIDYEKIFGRRHSHVLEIGFGMGDSLHAMALQHDDWSFIGIEVHRPGIGALLLKLQQDHLQNVKIIEADAVEILKQRIPDNTLHRILIFFPDPWHKKRHHKRRMINKSFIDLLHHKLKPKGILHLATDWQPYAEQMLELLQTHLGFRNLSKKNDYISNENLRPKTKFERRGERLGHGIWDLLFERQ